MTTQVSSTSTLLATAAELWKCPTHTAGSDILLPAHSTPFCSPTSKSEKQSELEQSLTYPRAAGLLQAYLLEPSAEHHGFGTSNQPHEFFKYNFGSEISPKRGLEAWSSHVASSHQDGRDATDHQRQLGRPVLLTSPSPPPDPSWLWSCSSAEIESRWTPRCRAWRQLSAGNDGRALFATEAGPRAYDALTCSSSALVPTIIYCRSLLALAIGRESALFRKHPDGCSFKPLLSYAKIIGHSHQVLQELQGFCLRCGMLFLSLRSFAQRIHTSPHSATTVALGSAIRRVIQLVQSIVGSETSSYESVLELNQVVHRVLSIFSALHSLASSLPLGSSDEHIMDTVFSHTAVAESIGGAVYHIMCEVLRTVSRPWVEFVEEWIGTKSEAANPLALTEVGRRKHFVVVRARTSIDEPDSEVEEVDFHLDMDRMPRFLPDDVAQELFETGRNLRFIQACHLNHVLSRLDIASFAPPPSDWQFDWKSILELERKTSVYRRTLLATIESPCDGTPYTSYKPAEAAVAVATSIGANHFSVYGESEDRIQAHVLSSIQALDEPMAALVEDDFIARSLQRQLFACDPDSSDSSTGLGQTPHWSLLPILSFGPIIRAQALVVNRESLRLLYDSHHLCHHFNTLHEFFLLGNGFFCSRLATALFDSETQAPPMRAIGLSVGLRLGARDVWPPTTSELRLVLIGLLSESERASSYEPDTQHLGLSFTIRNISSEGIDQCLDPDSLQALDFLRLTYNAPHPLGSIITPVALTKYDTIFMFLLRMLRMQSTVTRFSRSLTGRRASAGPLMTAKLRLVMEANHFVTVLMSHFLDTVVAISWNDFMIWLRQMRINLQSKEPESLEALACSPRHIVEEHNHTLDSIMSGLFLRTRQKPVLKLLEDVLEMMLSVSKQAVKPMEHSSGSSDSDTYKLFKKKVHLFIVVCRGLATQNRPSNRHDRRGRSRTDEGQILSHLVSRLDLTGQHTSG